MVARIKTACFLELIFNYNENKVKENTATCILASGYPKDLEQLSVSNKLRLLLNQAALRSSIEKPGVHISLNFDPSENHSQETLVKIAEDYMEGIGFKDQPYLVYEHTDTGHQHLHIVSLKVKPDSDYIRTNYIAINKSEPTRLLLEEKYHLVPAQQGEEQKEYRAKPADIEGIRSGKKNVRREISGVLDAVLNTYRYTSLAELNAVLQLNNVRADRGGEGSRTFKHGGLFYRVIDEHGKTLRKPIKASRFFNSPTLAFLKENFAKNGTPNARHIRELKVAVDLALLDKRNSTIDSFCSSLAKEGIDVVLRKNEEGRIYGITYVDHHNKSVYNGSKLGKKYAASSVVNQCLWNATTVTSKRSVSYPSDDQPFAWTNTPHGSNAQSFSDSCFNDATFLDALMQPEYTGEQIPYHLRNTRRKKRRKRNSQNGTM